MRSLIVLVIAVSALVGLRAEAYSVEDFVQLPEFRSVALSPDGNKLAVAAPAGDQTGLAVFDISGSSIEVLMAAGLRSGEHVDQILWANDERILFTTNREVGTLYQPVPTGRIYGVNPDGSRNEMLYGAREGSQVFRRGEILSLLPDEPNHVRIASYAHDRPRPHALRLDVRNGRTTRREIGPLEGGGLLADHDGAIRFAYHMNEEGDAMYSWRPDTDSEWQEFETEFDGNEIGVHGFAENNRDIVLSTRESDRMGLYRFDPESGESEFLLGSERVEIGGFVDMMRGTSSVLRDRDGKAVVGAVIEDGRPEMKFIDPEEETSRLQRTIAQAFPGQFARIVSFSEGDRAIVQVEADIASQAWFLFDLEEMSAQLLLSNHQNLDPQDMQPMEPVRIEARDGLELHGYLTRPAVTNNGEDDNEEGGQAEQEPFPTIVVVHGGPHGPRDAWRFSTEVQLLANRGYAVLQVNFRGSGGYGHEFEEAGHREWGAAMQDDVTDATRWAIEEGIADADRVCIYGGSYGGYAALMGLVREPGLYACGAAVVGVYDLPLMFEVGDIPETPQGQAYLHRVLGDDEEELKARSPARRVAEIEDPLFISHGEEDIRAHVDHYHFLVEQLEAAEIEYEGSLYESEGHGYYQLENRKSFYTDLLDFFDRHLGQ